MEHVPFIAELFLGPQADYLVTATLADDDFIHFMIEILECYLVAVRFLAFSAYIFKILFMYTMWHSHMDV